MSPELFQEYSAATPAPRELLPATIDLLGYDAVRRCPHCPRLLWTRGALDYYRDGTPHRCRTGQWLERHGRPA